MWSRAGAILGKGANQAQAEQGLGNCLPVQGRTLVGQEVSLVDKAGQLVRVFLLLMILWYRLGFL